jgi:mono/diheme cytochrome c family protein
MPLAAGLLVIAPFLGDASDDGLGSMTSSERHGREVFIREGCATCHQAPWNHSPGPDLYREYGARPADWHLTHLFSPRAVTPLSVMPSYARLFNGAPDQPKQESRDLVAYLETLGRRDELGTAPNLGKAPPPSRAVRVGEVPALLPAGDRAAGLKLFGNYCVGCHGMKGEGDGPGAAGLRPKPANLTVHRYAREQIVTVLWNGVAGTAMPAWRDQPLDRIASLVEAVESMSQPVETSAPDAAQLATGARVFAANCSQCHGERGAGDGFSAASLTVAPANFQRQQPSLSQALRAIAVGVEGTPMAPWTSRLSEDEVLAVAHYVRSLYTGGAK